MKKINSALFCWVLIIFFIFSCSKKEDPAPTKEHLLARTNGWKITATTVNGIDSYTSEDACVKDNIYKFVQTGNTNGGTYTKDEGATKCNSGDPQVVETGSWTFNSGKTEITIVNGPINLVLKIGNITSTNLSVSYSFTFLGATYSVAQTYTGL